MSNIETLNRNQSHKVTSANRPCFHWLHLQSSFASIVLETRSSVPFFFILHYCSDINLSTDNDLVMMRQNLLYLLSVDRCESHRKHDALNPVIDIAEHKPFK